MPLVCHDGDDIQHIVKDLKGNYGILSTVARLGLEDFDVISHRLDLSLHRSDKIKNNM